MEAALPELFKSGPWAGLCGLLIWWIYKLVNSLLAAYVSAGDIARKTAESNQALSATIESMDRTIATTQTTMARCEATSASVYTAIAEMRAEMRARQ